MTDETFISCNAIVVDGCGFIGGNFVCYVVDGRSARAATEARYAKQGRWGADADSLPFGSF